MVQSFAFERLKVTQNQRNSAFSLITRQLVLFLDLHDVFTLSVKIVLKPLQTLNPQC